MTDTPPANTFPHRTPKGPRKPRDPDAPAYYQLSPETWALILAEYRAGATAPELVLKWRVSLYALRQQISRSGSTKRGCGDAQARGQAEAWAAGLDAATEAERHDSAGARAARLFDDMEGEPDAAGDPAALARVAALASGRAMRARLWGEAKALTALAESYQRMAAQERAREAGTLETLPLSSVFDVCTALDDQLEARFHISERPGAREPDRDLKEAWWRWKRFKQQAEDKQFQWIDEQTAHVRRLEVMMRGAGLTPPEWAPSPATLTV